jgi:ABC-2 type transport system ATP-binding protein
MDLQVESGQFFGFLGPNGAGKSTTINAHRSFGAHLGRMSLLGIDFTRHPVEVKRNRSGARGMVYSSA